MSRHLSPEALVSALDTGVDARHVDHLRACAACRAALEDLRQVVDDVTRAGEVPEPSPLFWDQMSRRIHAAASAHSAPATGGRWRPRVWWPVLGSLAAALLVVVAWQAGVRDRGLVDAARGSAPGNTVPAEPSWDTIGDLASTLSVDDVRLVVGASPESAVTDLTPTERDAFVRLIDAELGGAR